MEARREETVDTMDSLEIRVRADLKKLVKVQRLGRFNHWGDPFAVGAVV
jgi:hypothetical protein